MTLKIWNKTKKLGGKATQNLKPRKNLQATIIVSEELLGTIMSYLSDCKIIKLGMAKELDKAEHRNFK